MRLDVKIFDSLILYPYLARAGWSPRSGSFTSENVRGFITRRLCPQTIASVSKK